MDKSVGRNVCAIPGEGRSLTGVLSGYCKYLLFVEVYLFVTRLGVAAGNTNKVAVIDTSYHKGWKRQ